MKYKLKILETQGIKYTTTEGKHTTETWQIQKSLEIIKILLS